MYLKFLKNKNLLKLKHFINGHRFNIRVIFNAVFTPQVAERVSNLTILNFFFFGSLLSIIIIIKEIYINICTTYDLYSSDNKRAFINALLTVSRTNLTQLNFVCLYNRNNTFLSTSQEV